MDTFRDKINYIIEWGCFSRCITQYYTVWSGVYGLSQVNEKPFEDLKHCVASLTKGVVKFAQVSRGDRGHVDRSLLLSTAASAYVRLV